MTTNYLDSRTLEQRLVEDKIVGVITSTADNKALIEIVGKEVAAISKLTRDAERLEYEQLNPHEDHIVQVYEYGRQYREMIRRKTKCSHKGCGKKRKIDDKFCSDRCIQSG